jgi:hypothetical protein
MREYCVTQSLWQYRQEQLKQCASHPLIFAVLTGGSDHNDATQTYSFKMMQMCDKMQQLVAVQTTILNLGQHHGPLAYSDFNPLLSLLPGQEAGSSRTMGQLSVAAQAQAPQMLEKVFGEAIQGLEALSRQAVQRNARVQQLRHDNELLLQELQNL